MVSTNHNTDQWVQMTPIERAEAVAVYRLRRFIEMHEMDAQNSAAKRKQAKSKARQ